MEISQEFDVAIIGQGYVGFPLAMESVIAGWRVLGVDTLESRVESIQAGFNPTVGGYDARLISAQDRGRYQVSKSFDQVAFAKTIVICVPTPLNKERLPDLSSLDTACTEIAKNLSSDTLVINESTSYPGTLRNRIIPLILSKSGLTENDLYFATAPERVNPGDAVWNQLNTPRVVSGINEDSSNKARKFYETICEKVVIVESPEIAEAAKLLENTFRLVNLALVNEFDRICVASRLDTRKVIAAAESKPYGFMPFFPGLGVGGHCIPVDPLYLTWWAEQLGIEPKLILESAQVNLSKPKKIASGVLRFLQDNELPRNVLIFGLSYKQGVADTRESPSLALKFELESLGVQTAWTDELVKVWNDEYPAYDFENYKVCIVAVSPSIEFLERILDRDWHILDCTGTLPSNHKVIRV